ncbi:MAG: hypothetical protein ACT4PM_03620 [Gemmatimonadales bacterium]
MPRWVIWFGVLAACRGTPPGQAQGGGSELERIVDSLRPAVERATGLGFTGPTRSALRTREEVHAYLLERLREDFPPEREEGVRAAYRLLGLIPDTLDLRSLLLDLYTEQVAGFYDPKTRTLYGIAGANPAQLRLVLAHELVHALQHQYLPVDSLMEQKGNADRQSAAQAVLEGHATIASIRVLTPGQDVMARPEFWELFREQIRQQQSSMEVFAQAPLAIRFEVLFPYLYGAGFMRWWDSTRGGQGLPKLNDLPVSTEHVLHPTRYARGDQPIPLRFRDSTPDVLYEDTMGELTVQVVSAVQRGLAEVPAERSAGWGGDRFRVYRSSAGPALVWYTVWDDSASAGRFEREIGMPLMALQRPGYRTEVERVRSAGSSPAVRLVIGPTGWEGWGPGHPIPWPIHPEAAGPTARPSVDGRVPGR